MQRLQTGGRRSEVGGPSGAPALRPLPSDLRPATGHLLVLIAAFLGWLFDGFEIGLFPVVARPALLSLLGNANDAQVGPWMARITACFLVGAAGGGVVFGWLGDRIGRVRALAVSILTYSLFSGLSYFAQSPWQLGGCVLILAGAYLTAHTTDKHRRHPPTVGERTSRWLIQPPHQQRRR